MTSNTDFYTSFMTFVKGVEAIVQNNTLKNFPNLPVPSITFEKGNRYVRIVRHDHGQRTVHCFVDTTNGDVLKAASWKAPAKTARGNIFNADNGLGAVGPYGAAYLR